MPSPVGNGFQDFRRRSFVRIVGQAAPEHASAPVHDGDLVTSPVPQHLDAVRAFVGVQKSKAPVYFVSVKNLHAAKIR